MDKFSCRIPSLPRDGFCRNVYTWYTFRLCFSGSRRSEYSGLTSILTQPTKILESITRKFNYVPGYRLNRESGLSSIMTKPTRILESIARKFNYIPGYSLIKKRDVPVSWLSPPRFWSQLRVKEKEKENVFGTYDGILRLKRSLVCEITYLSNKFTVEKVKELSVYRSVKKIKKIVGMRC